MGILSDRQIEMKKVQKIKGKDAFTRILFKATRMLFYELLNTIYQMENIMGGVILFTLIIGLYTALALGLYFGLRAAKII